MNNGFMMKPGGKWTITVLAAFVGLGLCCCATQIANYAFLYNVTGGDMPSGLQNGFEFGQQLGQQQPLYGLIGLMTICLPPLFFLIAGVAAYFIMDRYQKRTPPPPIMPPTS